MLQLEPLFALRSLALELVTLGRFADATSVRSCSLCLEGANGSQSSGDVRAELRALSETIVADNARHLTDAIPYLLAAWRSDQRHIDSSRVQSPAATLSEMLLRWCDAASRAHVTPTEGTAQLYTAVRTAFVPSVMCVMFC